MKTVQQIIEKRGGIETLRDNPLKIEVEGFMPLCIEWIGYFGPRSCDVVSVMHWYMQNGDLMRDPDMTFALVGNGEWMPLSYRQDSLGMYQEAVFEDEDGVKIRPKLLGELTDFAETWDENIREQGFAD